MRAGAPVPGVGQGSRRAERASRPLHAEVESGVRRRQPGLERSCLVVSRQCGGEAVVCMASQGSRAAQQHDAAVEGRLEAYGGAIIGSLIVSHGEVVRPSQLIASVGRTCRKVRESRK
jgi:hypothetical protein